MATIKTLTTKVLLLAACLIIGMISGSFANAMIWEKTPTTSPIHEFSGIHEFTGLPLTQDGWTDFRYMIQEQNLYQDARVVFVSSTKGNDNIGSDGHYTVTNLYFDEHGMFQPEGPVKAYQTIAKGKAQMRDGYPDIILLKRGDVWTGENFGNWNTAGPSKQARQIISSYGEGGRPHLVYQGVNIGLFANNIIMSGISFTTGDWLGAAQQSAWRSSSSSTRHHLIEDCKIDQHDGSGVYGHDVAVRRCVYTNMQSGNGSIWTDKQAENFLFEENISHAPNRNTNDPTHGTLNGRHLYLNGLNWETTIVRRNIFYGGERGATTLRRGGINHNNLYVGDDSISMGGGTNHQAGIQFPGRFFNNVVTKPSPNNSSLAALEIRACDNFEAYGNIWTDAAGVTGGYVAISFRETNLQSHGRHWNTSVYDNIVYGFSTNRAVHFNWMFEPINVVIQDNDFFMVDGVTVSIVAGTNRDHEEVSWLNNRYHASAALNKWFDVGDGTFAAWQTYSGETGVALTGGGFPPVEYPAPGRTLDSYNQSLGGPANFLDFLNEALQQSRYNWRVEYTACEANDYFRAGFGKGTIECTY